MKIINYKKKKANLYEIVLDNNDKVELYDEVILKYNLLIKKEIDISLLNQMLNDNKYYELYNKVIKYLSIKMRSEKEIFKKFKDYDKDATKKVIKKLKSEGYLNNSEYIKAYINDAINLKMVGFFKIKKDLLELGFKEDEILLYLNTIDDEIWYQKIVKLVDNMIKHNHKYGSNYLKQKIVYNLTSKGFAKDDILSYLDSINISNDEDIYNKEYSKLKLKLSRKYDGTQLELEIQKCLKAKGF